MTIHSFSKDLIRLGNINISIARRAMIAMITLLNIMILPKNLFDDQVTLNTPQSSYNESVAE